MLTLTRKVGEQIVIGDNVVITVVRVQGRGCRLGVDAPVQMEIRTKGTKPKTQKPNASQAK